MKGDHQLAGNKGLQQEQITSSRSYLNNLRHCHALRDWTGVKPAGNQCPI